MAMGSCLSSWEGFGTCSQQAWRSLGPWVATPQIESVKLELSTPKYHLMICSSKSNDSSCHCGNSRMPTQDVIPSCKRKLCELDIDHVFGDIFERFLDYDRKALQNARFNTKFVSLKRSRVYS
eukprot:3067786-Karenia_brevis.AAC.2